MVSPLTCNSPRRMSASPCTASARLRLLANGVANRRAARFTVRPGAIRPPSTKPVRTVPSLIFSMTVDMGLASGLPAAPQALEGRAGALASFVEPEQPGVVVQAEHQGIDLEGELGDVGVAAQVAQFHRLRDRLLQFVAPAGLLPHHAVVQRAVAAVVLAHGRQQHAAALVLAAPLEPVRHDRAQPRQAARLLQRGQQHPGHEALAAGVEHGQLQVFARAEVGEHAALGHAHVAGQAADRQAFQPVATGQRVGVVEDGVAGGRALAGAGCECHGGKIARPFVLYQMTLTQSRRTLRLCFTTARHGGFRMKIRNLGIPLATALLAACVTSPTGRSQLMVVSDSQMSQMGLAAFNDMRKQGKFVDAPRERAYATCVSRALVAVLPPPWNTQQWEVQIVGDDTANAFALPGGRIGVNKGMFKLADNQDQLAVVLGHELSHVVARHGAERVSDNLAAQAAVTAGTVYAGSRGGDANTAAALLGAGAELSILLPFSRTQESEADTLGQRYMAQAGFDPRAAVVLWQKMGAQGGSKPPAFLSTHPAPGNRAEALGRQAQQLLPVYQHARASGHAPDCHL